MSTSRPRPADASNELVYSNGVDAATGDYLYKSQSLAALAERAAGSILDPFKVEQLRQLAAEKKRYLSSIYPNDARQISQVGWGLLLPEGTDPAIRSALSPLIEHRHREVGCREIELKAGESATQLRKRHRIGPGPIDPERMPYYLLLVGDPETVPWEFQHDLDTQFAVGRLAFEAPEEYGRYARAVVEADESERLTPGSMAFFGPRNPNDWATELTSEHLIEKLSDRIASRLPDWEIAKIVGKEATKPRLVELLGKGEEPADLLFIAAHGLGFASAGRDWRGRLGALVCQEWVPSGPPSPMPDGQVFSAQDVCPGADLLGKIVFCYACHGAGFPAQQEGDAYPGSSAFIASLPETLLGGLERGIQAFVGHVHRTFGFSFLWHDVGGQTATFEDAFLRLLEGWPVGAAMEAFRRRYCELATQLSIEQREFFKSGGKNSRELVSLWAASEDARNYVILGDPAVRLRSSSLS